MLSPSSFRHAHLLAVLLPLGLLAAACSDDEGTSSSSGGGSGDGGSLPVTTGAAGGSPTSGEGGSGASTGDGGAGGGSVVPDTTAPTVVATDPADEDEGEGINIPITVRFSETMDPETLTDESFTLELDGAGILASVTPFDDRVVLQPDVELELGTSYTATITTQATDLAGNPLAEEYSWTFTTDDTLPLGPAPVPLGSAGAFVILAKSAISNVPTSAITGDVGLSPAAASYITGFDPFTRAGTRWTSPQVTGSLFAADNDPPTPDALTTAVSAMETAYTDAAGRPLPDELDLLDGILDDVTMPPGLYRWETGVTIPGDITLDGAANDTWIFQITGDLAMASDTAIVLAGGARARNVVWQVAEGVTLGTTAHAEGTFISFTSITLETGASVNGRLFAHTAVVLAGNAITEPVD